jgi:hypothetical protein
MSQPLPIPLTGGLQLELPKSQGMPGSLLECLNYEVNLRSGYSRIEGYERFDGQPEVSSVQFWRLETSAVNGEIIARNDVYFTAGQVGYVLSVTTSGLTTTIDVVFHGAHDRPVMPALLTGDSGDASIDSLTVIRTPSGTAEDFDYALDSLAVTQRAEIGEVPGRTGSDVIHAFWLKNRAYAVRDLCRVPFTGGLYTDADEGKYITIGVLDYEILDVVSTGEDSGVLTIDCTPGTGTAADPIGTPDLDDMALSGDLDDGTVGAVYSDGLTLTGGVPPITWSIVDGVLPPPDIRLDPDSGTFTGANTNAALYKATTTGWERVALGREMPFRGGTSNILNFDRSLALSGAAVLDTGFEFPTDSSINGTTTTAINADDGTLAALTGPSGDVFIASGFDFSEIPATAIIRGIEVTIERRSDTANQAIDYLVDLIGLGIPTTNKAKGSPWPDTIAVATYGSATDLWGGNGLTPASFGAGFGVRLVAFREDPATAAIGGVDYIACKVYYSPRETTAYVWNGSTDIEIGIRHIQVLGGEESANTAHGWISLTADKNADKARLINDGDEIRTAAAGGGNLIAVAAGRDRPIWLPGQEDIENNGSQYQSLISNFYFQNDYDAAWTVQGCGPCWYYDGVRTIRIRVPLGDYEDSPRHVERHGTSLALGYYPGTLILSSASDPFETRGERGAQVFNTGDRMTVLAALSGDAIGIGGEARIDTLRGFTEDSFFKAAITAQRGLIEYTEADMGKVLAADALGVLAIETPEALGSASSMYLSGAVDSWLRPRLQAGDTEPHSRIRPRCALRVREKNQYRLYFWDGWIMTVTFNGERPAITTQRYLDEDGAPRVVRAVCSGIDKDGRERLFVSFYGSGYLYEADAGRSFDGGAIPAYITLNPIQAAAQQQMRMDRGFIFGTAGGMATLSVSRAADYYSVDTTQAEVVVLGSADDPATIEQAPVRGGFDLPIEAYDLTLRFDSNTATEAPHCLQLINIMVDAKGVSRGHLRDR